MFRVCEYNDMTRQGRWLAATTFTEAEARQWAVARTRGRRPFLRVSVYGPSGQRHEMETLVAHYREGVEVER